MTQFSACETNPTHHVKPVGCPSAKPDQPSLKLDREVKKKSKIVD